MILCTVYHTNRNSPQSPHRSPPAAAHPCHHCHLLLAHLGRQRLKIFVKWVDFRENLQGTRKAMESLVFSMCFSNQIPASCP